MESGKRKRGYNGYSYHSLPCELPRDLDGYTIQSLKLGGATADSLVRDCGDYVEVSPFKGTIFNNPPFEGTTVRGIPCNQDGLLVKVPYPPFKIPKKMPRDPQESAEVWHKALKENLEQLKINVPQAFEKALRRQACSEEEQKEEGEAHNTTAVTAVYYLAPLPEPGCELVDKDSDGEKRTGSSSSSVPAPVPEPGCELINKDDSGEKGTGSSSSGNLTKDINEV
ncbi:hypothetical protein OROMI_023511 [Orobanche minor]